MTYEEEEDAIELTNSLKNLRMGLDAIHRLTTFKESILDKTIADVADGIEEEASREQQKLDLIEILDKVELRTKALNKTL